MKKLFLISLFFFFCVSPVAGFNSVPETAIVACVIDGDTIELLDGRTVRYIGINTPETKHPTKGQECFGQEAKAKNIELVEGKEVRLQKDVSETDRYGRLLRYVYVDEQMINEQLVAEGYAFSSPYPPDIMHQETFNNAQTIANDNKKGLWGAECPTEGEVQGAVTNVWIELLLDTIGISTRSPLRKPLESLLTSFLQ